MKGTDMASVDLKYERLERQLLRAESVGNDVRVNLIAQQMAALEADLAASLCDCTTED